MHVSNLFYNDMNSLRIMSVWIYSYKTHTHTLNNFNIKKTKQHF